MPSYANFRNDFRQRARNNNSATKPKSMVKERDISEARKNRIIDWVTFYRRNLHLFALHYLGIKLHTYQKLWLYMLGVKDSTVVIAARADAKSWITALYAVCRAILYPGSLIVVVSSTMNQAGGIVNEKVAGMRDMSTNLAREIRRLTANANTYEVEFHNGSVIRVVSARDSSRGKRATAIVYDEFRIIDGEIVDSVIRPFAYIRQPPYMKDERYSHLIEEPKEIFISSAYNKSAGWWWGQTKKTIKMLLNGENVGFLTFDYLLAIRHKIKSLKQILRERQTMSPITFQEEYENIPTGEGALSYFKLSLFMKNRGMKKAFYPQREDTYNPKKNPYGIDRTLDEIRIVSVDIATRSGRSNDLTIITCIRLLPTSRGYHREVVYMESHSGKNTVLQAKRIKQIYSDFEADTIVLDIANAGIAIYDALGLITKDDERGIEYDAMTVMQHESIDEKTYDELAQRTIALNALPCIYPIFASAKLNSTIAVALRGVLQKRLITFLIDENAADEYLTKNNKEYRGENDEKAFFLNPYVQTSLMINEAINLEMSLVAGNIKLEEPEGGRKDRYTSLSYGNYYASLLDVVLLKETDDGDGSDILAISGIY